MTFSNITYAAPLPLQVSPFNLYQLNRNQNAESRPRPLHVVLIPSCDLCKLIFQTLRGLVECTTDSIVSASYTGVSCVILSDCCDAGLTEVLDTAIMEYVNTATTNNHLVGYHT